MISLEDAGNCILFFAPASFVKGKLYDIISIEYLPVV